MKKIYLSMLAVVIALGGSAVAYAQQTDVNAQVNVSVPGSPVSSIRDSIKKQAEEAREKFQADRKEVEDMRTADQAKFGDERKQIGDNRRENRADIMASTTMSTSTKKEAFAENRQEFKNKLEGLRGERVIAFGNRTAKRLTAAIDRITSLITRLEERLTLLEGKNKNIDTKSAHDLLTGATTDLSDAKIALADFQAKIGTLTATSTPSQAFDQVKTSAETVITKIKSAHSKVISAIESVKASGAVDGNVTASSTSN